MVFLRVLSSFPCEPPSLGDKFVVPISSHSIHQQEDYYEGGGSVVLAASYFLKRMKAASHSRTKVSVLLEAMEWVQTSPGTSDLCQSLITCIHSQLKRKFVDLSDQQIPDPYFQGRYFLWFLEDIIHSAEMAEQFGTGTSSQFWDHLDSFLNEIVREPFLARLVVANVVSKYLLVSRADDPSSFLKILCQQLDQLLPLSEINTMAQSLERVSLSGPPASRSHPQGLCTIDPKEMVCWDLIYLSRLGNFCTVLSPSNADQLSQAIPQVEGTIYDLSPVDGGWLPHLMRWGQPIVGIENSQMGLRQAQTVFDRWQSLWGAGPLTLIHDDLVTHDYPVEAASVVWCWHVLHHLRPVERQVLLKKIASLLKKGGIMVCSLLTHNPVFESKSCLGLLQDPSIASYHYEPDASLVIIFKGPGGRKLPPVLRHIPTFGDFVAELQEAGMQWPQFQVEPQGPYERGGWSEMVVKVTKL